MAIMEHHPDKEAANAIVAIVVKHLGFVNLATQYTIANDILKWFDNRSTNVTNRKKRTVKHRVDYIESERGWGTKVDDTKLFDTEEEARAEVKRCNKDLPTDHVPEYYYMAKYVGEVIVLE